VVTFSSFNWNRIKFILAPVSVIITIRVLGAVWLYQILSTAGTFHTPWMDSNPSMIPARSSWLWLFNAWDSLQFTRIALFGYVNPNYVYLPGYPILIYIAGRLTGDYWFGAFLIAQMFGIGSVVVFQLLAEQYMESDEALCASLLMATFPFISVFTTLSYSEPLFLFSTLSTWYLYKKERILSSVLLAGIASVTRIYGFLIVLPILFDLFKSKRYRQLLYLSIPAAFLGSWLLYCYLSTGDWFVSWTDEKYWQMGGVGDGIKIMQAISHYGIQGLIKCCAGLDPTIFWSFGLFVILIAISWRVDHSLWTYAVAVSGLLVFTTTYYISLLRYLAFIFPIWLSIRVKNPWVVAICIIILVPMIMIVWLYAIAVTFVG
jgi:hypothetical protein